MPATTSSAVEPGTTGFTDIKVTICSTVVTGATSSVEDLDPTTASLVPATAAGDRAGLDPPGDNDIVRLKGGGVFRKASRPVYPGPGIASGRVSRRLRIARDQTSAALGIVGSSS
jgi:hypothetical protein